MDLKVSIELRKACYKKLWKLLIDKDMNKKTLAANAGISMTTLGKMGKGDTITVETLIKICDTLECDICDVLELIEADK